MKIRMKIAQQNVELKQAVLITRANGEEERQVLAYFTNGEESTAELRGLPLRLRVRWQGAEMVIEANYGEKQFRDYWSLSEDGRTLTMEHRDDDLAGQRSVFDRV